MSFLLGESPLSTSIQTFTQFLLEETWFSERNIFQGSTWKISLMRKTLSWEWTFTWSPPRSDQEGRREARAAPCLIPKTWTALFVEQGGAFPPLFPSYLDQGGKGNSSIVSLFPKLGTANWVAWAAMAAQVLGLGSSPQAQYYCCWVWNSYPCCPSGHQGVGTTKPTGVGSWLKENLPSLLPHAPGCTLLTLLASWVGWWWFNSWQVLALNVRCRGKLCTCRQLEGPFKGCRTGNQGRESSSYHGSFLCGL